MSIKSTVDISRECAIERILYVSYLVIHKKYKDIESNCFESDGSLSDFVMSERDNSDKYIIEINSYTNQMIEDIIDEPFFRLSMFDNYLLY